MPRQPAGSRVVEFRTFSCQLPLIDADFRPLDHEIGVSPCRHLPACGDREIFPLFADRPVLFHQDDRVASLYKNGTVLTTRVRLVGANRLGIVDSDEMMKRETADRFPSRPLM
jgi:hypothetical protein